MWRGARVDPRGASFDVLRIPGTHAPSADLTGLDFPHPPRAPLLRVRHLSPTGMTNSEFYLLQPLRLSVRNRALWSAGVVQW